MRRVLVLLAALAGAAFGLEACGGSGGGGGVAPNTRRGASVIALPFLPSAAGETLTLGLTNLASSPAPVTVTAFHAAGGAYGPGAVPILLPANGAEELSLSTFTGLGGSAGGWLQVDTRDVGTLDPVTGVPVSVSTTGLVTAVMMRSIGSTETDAAAGLAPRGDRAEVTVDEHTIDVQVVNLSYVPMAGGAIRTAADFDVVIYDESGGISDAGTVNVPASGAFSIDPGLLQLGQVQIVPTPAPGQSAPAGTVFRFGIAALEDDPQVLIETRYLEPAEANAAQLDVAFDLRFGTDAAGNVYDFGIYLANPSPTSTSVTVNQIRTAGGAPLLASPRIVTLAGHAAKFESTTTVESLGLDAGEQSVFNDIFGNVDLAVGMAEVSVQLSIPRGVNVTARDYDSRFKAYRRILAAYRLSTSVAIPNMEVEPFTTTGVKNEAVFTNRQTGSVTLNVRAFTPGGTQYQLPSVVLPGLTQVRWSPDGQIFREDPTDTTSPPVPFMTFFFSTSGGTFFDGLRTRVDATDLIFFVRPYAVYDLRQE